MLPPQLQGSMATARRSSLTAARPLLHQASVSALLGTPSHAQTRSFWGWRRHGLQEWASQLDPVYHRFNRVRTLQTRAKLMEKLRRRGKFDWDASRRSLFSPKDIRFASHWNGRKWNSRQPDDAKRAVREADELVENAEDDISSELNRREKEWKEQMEAMRKRVEQDPYEAVFGKRFEPFWSPLVPSWMREEMDLQRSSLNEKQKKPAKDGGEQGKTFDQLTAELSQYVPGNRTAPTTPEMPDSAFKNEAHSSARTYTAITRESWDSWTNKAKRTEWDSATGRTRRFEYDPVSNRMVPVEAPKSRPTPAKEVSSEQTLPTPLPPSPLPPLSRSPDMQSLVNTPNRQGSLEIPVKTFDEEFKSVSTPYDQEDVAQAPTNPRKPAALDNLPANDIDRITADNVRASMGKVQRSLAPVSISSGKTALENDFDKKSTATDYDYEDAWSKLRHRHKPMTEQKQSQWDQAEQAMISERELSASEKRKAELLRDEHGLFHIEGQKRNLADLNHKIVDVNAPSASPDGQVAPPSSCKQAGEPSSKTRLATALGRYEAARQEKEKAPILQPSLDRMQSKELEELDDSAAHESTEPIGTASSVPKDWARQADLLQEHRVKRTSPTRPYCAPTGRWIDDMNAKKAAWEASQPQPSPEEVRRTEKLRKAKEMLEAEVKEHKFKMQAHESRYAHKLRSLRQELDTAYKQSAVHSMKHVERIRFLEAELEKTQRASGNGTPSAKPANTEAHPLKEGRGEGDFCTNITKFADSGKWYKRPTTGAAAERLEQAEQKARDQALVKEVRDIYEKAYGIIDTKHRQPPATTADRSSLDKIKQKLRSQIDIIESEDVGNKARDEALAQYNPRQPGKSASGSAQAEQTLPTKKDVSVSTAAADTVRDEARARYKPATLINNAKSTRPDAVEAALSAYKSKPLKPCESTQAVEIPCDSALGTASAQHDNSREGAYHFKRDGLEAELVKQEQEARDARARTTLEEQSKLRNATAESLKRNVEVAPPSEPTSDKAAKLVGTSPPAEARTSVESAEVKTATDASWEEPPLYKVLAYDSGNDKMSTATTTSNSSGSETAISIPQALSQLYQPARFVPYFAELQKDGYQVIYGTRDLLVFKKVKTAVAASQTAIPAKPADETIGLHEHDLLGITPKENSLAQEAANYCDKYPPSAKPYDPTSIENGQMMPKENALAQEAAHAYDRAMQNRANPIDGTSKAAATTEPEETTRPAPKVRRQEDHFTGTRHTWNEKKHARHQRKAQRDEKEQRRGGAVKWALGVGFVASLTAYGIGAVAEAARKDVEERKRYEAILGKHSLEERKRWQEILDGKRGGGRWE